MVVGPSGRSVSPAGGSACDWQFSVVSPQTFQTYRYWANSGMRFSLFLFSCGKKEAESLAMIHYPKYVLQIQKPGWPISCIFVAIWISNEIVLRNMKRNYLRCVALVWACMGMVGRLCAIEADYVTFSPCDGAFCLSASGRSANVYVDEKIFRPCAIWERR